MGKIIRNGIEFSGACEDATAVNYNNSLSGLEAQTVQEAVDEVSNSLGGLEFAVVDGKPQWKERGADSFNPFSNLESAFQNKKSIYSLDSAGETVRTFTTTKAYKNLLVCGIAQDGTDYIWMRISNDKGLEFKGIFSVRNAGRGNPYQNFEIKIGTYHNVPENTTISFDVRYCHTLNVYEI